MGNGHTAAVPGPHIVDPHIRSVGLLIRAVLGEIYLIITPQYLMQTYPRGVVRSEPRHQNKSNYVLLLMNISNVSCLTELLKYPAVILRQKTVVIKGTDAHLMIFQWTESILIS